MSLTERVGVADPHGGEGDGPGATLVARHVAAEPTLKEKEKFQTFQENNLNFH